MTQKWSEVRRHPPVERLLSVVQAREELGGIGNSTFYRLVAEGSLPLVKIRRRSFVRASDIASFIERCAADWRGGQP